GGHRGGTGLHPAALPVGAGAERRRAALLPRARRGRGGADTAGTPRRGTGPARRHTVQAPDGLARRLAVGVPTWVAPAPPARHWRISTHAAATNCSYLNSSRSRSGRSAGERGRWILVPCISCRPCRSIGPSISVRTSRRTWTT